MPDCKSSRSSCRRFPAELPSGLHAKDSDATDKGLVACRLVDCLSAPTLWRYDVTETYSHVVRQNLQKRKLRVLNPARIHVFYWFNWLNLIGS